MHQACLRVTPSRTSPLFPISTTVAMLHRCPLAVNPLTSPKPVGLCSLGFSLRSYGSQCPSPAKLVDILLPYCTPPLPGDFVTDSSLLEEVWRGEMAAAIEPDNGYGAVREGSKVFRRKL